MKLTLGDLNVGDSGQIAGYAGGGGYRRQLLAMGLTPGTALKIIRRAPMGDPIELEIRGFSLSLRRDEAQCVLVQKEVCNVTADCSCPR